MLFLSQALEEQIKSLTSQIKEQEGKVKAAAPDEKQLKDLETKVNQYRKGQNSEIIWCFLCLLKSCLYVNTWILLYSDFDKANGAASKVEAEVQK